MLSLEALEEWGLPIPTEAGVTAFGDMLSSAWQAGGMGAKVGNVLDALQGGAANLAPALDAIPAESIPLLGSIFKGALQAVRWDRERAAMEGYWHLTSGCASLAFGSGWQTGAREDADVPSWTDCTNLTNARRRTVVIPQRVRAPWRPSGNFRTPKGNCGSGFAVNCGDGRGNRARPGAGGERCHGNADTSVLLYPYWCAAVPPGPAPDYTATINAGTLPKPSQGGPPYINLNLDMVEAQADILTGIEDNFRVRIDRVIRMRNRLASLSTYRVQLANPDLDWTLTNQQIQGSIAACDAFVSSRAALVRSRNGQKYVKQLSFLARAEVDPSAIKEAELMADKPATGGAPPVRKPKRLDAIRAAPPKAPDQGGIGAVLGAAAALGLGYVAWQRLKR